ncbi:amidohydrolase family protein [Streptomyces sp. NPDC046881]|uniref:amidohydrolase family protein n=1 Tax=Streptomyces sp. NPDC046881 TaxID=3155374 RepID=UPI0033F30243
MAAGSRRVRAKAPSLPDTVARLSGLVTETAPGARTPAGRRPYTDTALDVFGPGRLMAGSDRPVCTPAMSYTEVHALTGELTAELGEAERAAPAEGTAARVYDL